MTDYDDISLRPAASIRRRTWDVFISYAQDDAAIALSLGEAIESRGLTAWLSARLKAGESLQVIDQAIRSSGSAIVLLSAASLASRRHRREVAIAVEALPGACVFPVAVGEVDVRDLPSWLADRQLLHLRDGRYVEKLVDQLLPSLEAALGGRDREPSTTRVIGELPPRVPLVGVASYLRDLRAQRIGVTWVVGLAGSGKTKLAREFAFHVRDEVECVWWLSAAGARARELAQQLPLTDESTNPVGHGSRLVVIDGLDGVLDDVHELVAQLARLGGLYRVVITTRRASDSRYMPERDYTIITVGPLSRSEIADYLESFAPELRAQERTKIERIAQRFGGSPLLLRILTQALQAPSGADVLSAVTMSEPTVENMLHAILSRLSESQRRRLEVLAFCSGLLTLIRSSERWAFPGDEPLFSRLLDWGLCTEQGSRTFFTHQVIVDFLRSTAPRQALEDALAYVAPRLSAPGDARSRDLLTSVVELTGLAELEWNEAASANLAELLIWQASVWRAAGEPQRAQLLLPRILDLAMKSGQTPLRVRAMSLQSALAFDQGRVSEAIALERRTADLAVAALGPDHPASIASLANLATSLHAQGNLPEAIALLRRVIERIRASLSKGDPDLVAALGNLAIFLREAGLFNEAMRTLREAIDQAQAGRTRLQLDQTLGALLTDQGRLDEASMVLEDSLSRADRLHESGSPEALMACANLALIHARRGQHHKALSIQSEVIDRLEVIHGSDHPATLNARCNYAILLSQTGSPSEALRILADVVERRTRVLGADHLDTLQSLLFSARFYCDLGEDGRALAIYSRLLPDVTRVLGPDHALSLTVREERARQLARTGDTPGAQLAYRELLADLERTLPPNHPMVRRVQESAGIKTTGTGTSSRPGAVPRVNFKQLSPSQYERMVSVLLSREIQALREDGAGGDGGKDCYFSDAAGTHVYELKNFTGRMTSGRRRQVKRSLARAMSRAPRTWTLVVPIDPTPSEQRWFESLHAEVSAQLDWKGRTWLEEKLAQYPDIARYFTGAAEEVMGLLSEIAREDALPRDARALGETFSGAVRRLNEADPYYRFAYSISGDTTIVTARPRYPDAPKDRPLRVSATLLFDDSPTSRRVHDAFADFMNYGTRVLIPDANVEGLVVDAPGGLGAEFPAGEIILDGSFGPAPEAADTIHLRVPPMPPVRHSVSLHVEERSRGPAGGLRLVSRDRSRLLTLDLRIDPARHSYHARLAYRYCHDVLPLDAVPVLRLCAALANGEQMAFADLDGHDFGTAVGQFGPAEWPETYINCAEKLAEIQQLAGATFPLPLAFAPEDQRDMEYARRILNGEDVQAKWSAMAMRSRAETIRNLLEQIDKHGQPFAFAIVQDETLEVAGGRLPLGWVQRFVPSAQLTNLDEMQAWYAAGGEGAAEIRLEPVGSDDMTARHMSEGPPSPDQPTMPEGQSSN